MELNTNTPTINEGKVSIVQGNAKGSSGQTQLERNSHLTLQQFIAVEGRLPMRSSTSGRSCSACYTGKANNPQQASCGHICCTPCWMDRFKVMINSTIIPICVTFVHCRKLTKVVQIAVERY